MHISTKRTAHVQRNIFGNLIGSGFTKEEICFALEFTNADFKRYLTYQYEAEPATRNQKGYFAATLNRHTRPGKELPLPAIEFLGAIKVSWPDYNLLRGEFSRHYSEAIDTIQMATPVQILAPYFRAKIHCIFSGSGDDKVQKVINALNLETNDTINGMCEVAAKRAAVSWRE